MHVRAFKMTGNVKLRWQYITHGSKLDQKDVWGAYVSTQHT